MRWRAVHLTVIMQSLVFRSLALKGGSQKLRSEIELMAQHDPIITVKKTKQKPSGHTSYSGHLKHKKLICWAARSLKMITDNKADKYFL